MRFPDHQAAQTLHSFTHLSDIESILLLSALELVQKDTLRNVM